MEAKYFKMYFKCKKKKAPNIGTVPYKLCPTLRQNRANIVFILRQ